MSFERALNSFRGAFSREPLFVASAPGRVNLIGEHTDYNGGFVLPMAIDRACICAAAPAANPDVSRIVAVDVNESETTDLRATILPGSPSAPRGSWRAYVLGVAAQCQRAGHALRNLDIAIASDVPLGSGLSSSAALEVSVATMLEAALGIVLPPIEKARLSRRAEHEFAGVPCGIMDQYISVMGQRDHALLIDCRSEEATPVPMPPDAAIVVMNTNVRHALASGEYAKRKAACESAALKLSVGSLRDATLDAIAACASLSDEERRCARHVVSENARTLAAAHAMGAGDLSTLGRLMNESHESLRADYRVSCEELDVVVELARAVEGVYGARMTGGGFGGCAIALATGAGGERLDKSVPTPYRARFFRDCDVFASGPVDGAAMLSGR